MNHPQKSENLGQQSGTVTAGHGSVVDVRFDHELPEIHTLLY